MQECKDTDKPKLTNPPQNLNPKHHYNLNLSRGKRAWSLLVNWIAECTRIRAAAGLLLMLKGHPKSLNRKHYTFP